MATDRFQHELWHVWDLTHRAARGRERELMALRPKLTEFWQTLDRGVGLIEADLPSDASLLLISDHGFGPIEHYVNFNIWLLEQGYIALQDTFYVKQKHWFHRHGATPEWIYGVMSRLGFGNHRVSRFRGKQDSVLDRLGETLFLSRRHIDWSRTRAYAQGNFGQVFLNVRGRQPNGCIAPADVRPLLEDLKAGLMTIPHPETGEPLVEHVYEREELYHGPHADLSPDLTVVLTDWRYRTIGLHDFTTNKVISPAFGPTGDHRMEGILIASGPAFQAGAIPQDACLLDIAPTVLHLLGVPVPDDMDGRVLSEVLDPIVAQSAPALVLEPELAGVEASGSPGISAKSSYSKEDDTAIQQRLADLGYL
jgi:predicted AlkP superfamily phosphohydrolase/phosphomutase